MQDTANIETNEKPILVALGGGLLRGFAAGFVVLHVMSEVLVLAGF